MSPSFLLLWFSLLPAVQDRRQCCWCSFLSFYSGTLVLQARAREVVHLHLFHLFCLFSRACAPGWRHCASESHLAPCVLTPCPWGNVRTHPLTAALGPSIPSPCVDPPSHGPEDLWQHQISGCTRGAFISAAAPGTPGPGFLPPPKVGPAVGYALGESGIPAASCLEPRRPFTQRLREGGRQADVSPAPRGTEHGLHPWEGGLHPGAPCLANSLASPAERHTRCGGRGHGRSLFALGRLHGARGLGLGVVGVGPGSQPTPPRREESPSFRASTHISQFPGSRRVVCHSRCSDSYAGHGRGNFELYGGRTVPGGCIQGPERKETLSHRQCCVGPLWSVYSLRQWTWS